MNSEVSPITVAAECRPDDGAHPRSPGASPTPTPRWATARPGAYTLTEQGDNTLDSEVHEPQACPSAPHHIPDAARTSGDTQK
jgi:hypothetical protein